MLQKVIFNVIHFFFFLWLVAAAKAVETVYGVKPDLTREGGSIPVTLSFQDALKKNVLLLPMGRGDDVSRQLQDGTWILLTFFVWY